MVKHCLIGKADCGIVSAVFYLSAWKKYVTDRILCMFDKDNQGSSVLLRKRDTASD